MVLQKGILDQLVQQLCSDLNVEEWYSHQLFVFMPFSIALYPLNPAFCIQICRVREGLGLATNNEAEYQAMILGLKYALKKGFTSVCIQGDSKLVCMQVLLFL